MSEYQSAFNIAVKYGFCGDCRWGFDSEKCHQCDCYTRSVKVLQDLVASADKYRWHDLRKNPEDLPENGFYEVIIEDCDGYQWFAKAEYDNKVLITGNKKGFGFGYHYRIDYAKSEVIKWKEIEPFEDDNDSRTTTNK